MMKRILFLSIFIFLSLTATAQINTKMYRIAIIKVDSGQLENYKLALQEQMNTAIQLEPGVLSYTVVADKKDPSAITIFEVYANQEAYQSHIATPHFKKYKETVKNMVTSLELIDTDLLARVHQKEY
jgi:quinol monooxygenase YgiN